jgi:hypothetical protein
MKWKDGIVDVVIENVSVEAEMSSKLVDLYLIFHVDEVSVMQIRWQRVRFLDETVKFACRIVRLQDSL